MSGPSGPIRARRGRSGPCGLSSHACATSARSTEPRPPSPWRSRSTRRSPTLACWPIFASSRPCCRTWRVCLIFGSSRLPTTRHATSSRGSPSASRCRGPPPLPTLRASRRPWRRSTRRCRRWPPSCAIPPSWTARRLRSSKRCGSGWSSSSSGAPPSPAHDSFRRRGDRGAALANFRKPRLPGADPLLERPRPGAHRAVLQRGSGPARDRSRRREPDGGARTQWHLACPGRARALLHVHRRGRGDPALRRSDCRGALGPGGGTGELRRQSRSEVAQRPLRRKAQARRDPARSAHAGRNDLPGGRDRPERARAAARRSRLRRPRPSRRRPGARFRARQSFRRCSTGSIGSSSSPIGT